MDPNLMHLELDDDHTRFMSEPITRWTLLDFHRAVQMTISGQFETAVAKAAEGRKDTKTKAAADRRKWIGEGQKEFENARVRDRELTDRINRTQEVVANDHGHLVAHTASRQTNPGLGRRSSSTQGELIRGKEVDSGHAGNIKSNRK